MTTPAVAGVDRRPFFEAFIDLMYRQKNVGTAFDNYVAEDYVQHNPGLADGRDLARDVHLKIVRGEHPVAAVVDFYRVEGDRVVEHWDVIQPWPTTSANDHPMF